MEDTKYRVSVVNFQGKTKPIVRDKSNKRSALVALTNFWYLRGPEVVPKYVSATADQKYLTSQIVATIEKFYRSGGHRKKLPVLKEDFVNAARSLHRQASLDPVNTTCNNFKLSAEFLLFRMLGVTVLHGWVLDPDDRNLKSLAGLSYSNMVVLSTLTKQTPSSAGVSDVQKVTEEDTPAKIFMNASKHQLTTFGLHQLHDNVGEKELAVLYAKNEYNVLYKHDGDLFTLEVSEDKLAQLPAGMWRKLAAEEEQSFYVTGDFSPTKGQQEEKYKLANEWFMAKLSASGDKKKSTRKKKTKPKRNLTKTLEDKAKDSTTESVLHISDVGQGEGSSKSDVAGLASHLSSEEPSAPPTVAPPTIAEKFFYFLMQFPDENGAPYFESIVKEMMRSSCFKLYVPFSLLQKHDGNLAIQIQDGYPRIHNELKQTVVNFLIKYDADNNAATEHADLEIQNLPKPKCSTTMPLQTILQDSPSSSINTAPEPIDKLVIRIPPKKSRGHKSPACSEINISSQKRVLHLLDIKQHLLENTDFDVEELSDDIMSEDCIQMRMIVGAERKLAVWGPFSVEYSTVVQQLQVLLEGVDSE